MSDKEIIIRSLEKVERRIRLNRLLRELTFGLSIFLLVPVLFKTWDLFRPFRGITVIVVIGLWLIGVIGYFAWRISQKSTLAYAAAAIDHRATLRDEIKSAYWFLSNPTGVHRSSDWVELQVRRAARKASDLNIEKLYPRSVPPTIWAVVGLVVLFVGLNFSPLSEDHNWAYLEAAPAFSLTPEEQKLLNQTKELLKQAEKLDQPQLIQQLEQIIQDLEQGKIDTAEALKQLEDLKNLLDEGNLDMANVHEGLDEMAKDVEGSETKEVSEAMSEHDLQKTAEELRKLAEQLNSEDPAGMQAIKDALQQASENSNPSMQKLANDMKQAAQSLSDKDSKAAQDALNQAAKDVQDLQQTMQEQQAKNSASQQIQNLQDQLRQRQQQQQGQGQQQGEPQMGAQQQGQDGKKGQQQDKAGGDPANGQQGGANSEGGEGGKEGQPGQAGQQAQSGGAAGGQNPSGSSHAPMDIMGAPTKLNVKLEQEKLSGVNDGGSPQDLEEASKQERSKLDYRNVQSELSPAQKDVLNQDKIPWEYKALIKNYFQAIRQPRGKE